MTREEAIEIIKSATVYTPEEIEALETLIPELHESEDERIRKFIQNELVCLRASENKGSDRYNELSSAIAYLEKQEKQPQEELVYRLNGLMQEYIKEGKDDAEKEHRFKCYKLFWDALEDANFFEQKEQKPAEWDAKDKMFIKDCAGILDEAGYTRSSQRLLSMFPVTSAEWSKEEKEIIEKVVSLIKQVQDDEDWHLGKWSDDAIDLLESLLHQPKQEWSEDWREEDIQTRFAFYTYKDEDGVLYLSNVFVEEASRNHGFGTKILIAAEKVAETIGATTISLKVKQDSPANAWYRKNGYGYVAFEDGYDWLEKNLEYMKPVKPAEWEKATIDHLYTLASFIKSSGYEDDGEFLEAVANKLKTIHDRPAAEWSDEDEHRRQQSINVLERNGFHVLADWLKSLSPQSKQEWSEEDENYLEEIISDLKYAEKNRKSCTNGLIEECIHWLENRFKSLRPQPKMEWSEEDKKILDSLIHLYNREFGTNAWPWANGAITYGDVVKFLKSLRPSWKPSEDEERLINTSISFLKDFADKGYENAVECIGWLKSKLNGNSGK